MSRLSALAERLDAPLFVTNLTNVYYLTGFESSNAALLVRPGGSTTLYTDFRYAESARAVPDVEVEITKRAIMADAGGRLEGRVQFEADVLPYLEWERLSSGGADLVPTSGIVDSLRAVKDDAEVAKLQRAARIADRGLEALTAETWVGRTEREVAWRLHELLHAHGADELAFETIVASGPNGAHPHGRPTDRIIEKGTLVTVDWGARVDGYYSDCTRTFSTGGSLPDRLTTHPPGRKPTCPGNHPCSHHPGRGSGHISRSRRTASSRPTPRVCAPSAGFRSRCRRAVCSACSAPTGLANPPP